MGAVGLRNPSNFCQRRGVDDDRHAALAGQPDHVLAHLRRKQPLVVVLDAQDVGPVQHRLHASHDLLRDRGELDLERGQRCRLDLPAHWLGPVLLVALLSLGTIGYAAVGTLFAAMVSSTRLQGGLLAMMIFPIALPLVMVSTQLLMKTFRDGIAPSFGAVGVLVAFDVIFLVVSWLVFEWVLEP